MKTLKLFLISLMVAVFSISATAQTNKVLKRNQTYYPYTGISTDTVQSHALGSWEQYVYANKDYPVKLDFQIQLNRSVTTTFPKCTVKIQGKKFSTDASWTDVTSMTVSVPAGVAGTSSKGLCSDSVVTLSQTTTAQHYRYFRALLTGTAVSGKPAIQVAWTKWKFYR